MPPNNSTIAKETRRDESIHHVYELETGDLPKPKPIKKENISETANWQGTLSSLKQKTGFVPPNPER